MANTAHPCRFIGVAINSRRVDDVTYRAEQKHIESEWGLPACDVFREDAGPLVDALQKIRKG